ncbi:MAG: hypothetical protein MUO59_03820 [Actinobacteria bacterium]|nr:hypothetical protein [Actinomycetota bacterium]
MPEESVATYINNTITFVIFILICIIVFAFIYLASRGIRKKVLARNQNNFRIDIDVDNRGTGFKETGTGTGSLPPAGADPFIRKNIAILGTVLVFMILSLVLALAVFYFSRNMGINTGLYTIGTVLIGLVIMLVYIIRSRIIN